MTLFAILAVCIGIDLVSSSILVIQLLSGYGERVLLLGLVLLIPYLVHIVVYCIFWYKAWRTIHDPHARTTPGKAVGFMFIPVFNLYWAFVLLWGFAKDYNAFCRRHNIGSPPEHLPAWYFLTVAILLGIFRFVQFVPLFGIIFGIGFYLTMLVLLYKTARAVAAIEKQ